jgi:hypothetical protein
MREKKKVCKIFRIAKTRLDKIKILMSLLLSFGRLDNAK